MYRDSAAMHVQLKQCRTQWHTAKGNAVVQVPLVTSNSYSHVKETVVQQEQQSMVQNTCEPYYLHCQAMQPLCPHLAEVCKSQA